MERMKLTITKVSEITKVGNKQIPKLSFQATCKGGSDLSYFTFRGNLFETIQSSKEIDAEVETSSREHDGNTYVDRKVNQIYVEGAPVAIRGEGKGSWGKSPEERTSIEGQKAADITAQLWIAGKLDDTEEIIDLRAWLLAKLRAGTNITESPRQATPSPAQVVTEGFANRGAFFQYWQKRGQSQANILEFAGVKKVEEIDIEDLHPKLLKVYNNET